MERETGLEPACPAWEQVEWPCLQQLGVSGALYRLTASLATSTFSSMTASKGGFIKVHFQGIRTSISARHSMACSSATRRLRRVRKTMGVLGAFSLQNRSPSPANCDAAHRR